MALVELARYPSSMAAEIARSFLVLDEDHEEAAKLLIEADIA